MELLRIFDWQLHNNDRAIIVLSNKMACATVANIGVQLRHPAVAVVPLVAGPGGRWQDDPLDNKQGSHDNEHPDTDGYERAALTWTLRRSRFGLALGGRRVDTAGTLDWLWRVVLVLGLVFVRFGVHGAPS